MYFRPTFFSTSVRTVYSWKNGSVLSLSPYILYQLLFSVMSSRLSSLLGFSCFEMKWSNISCLQTASQNRLLSTCGIPHSHNNLEWISDYFPFLNRAGNCTVLCGCETCFVALTSPRIVTIVKCGNLRRGYSINRANPSGSITTELLTYS